jgi:hypothetical protein
MFDQIMSASGVSQISLRLINQPKVGKLDFLNWSTNLSASGGFRHFGINTE